MFISWQTLMNAYYNKINKFMVQPHYGTLYQIYILSNVYFRVKMFMK